MRRRSTARPATGVPPTSTVSVAWPQQAGQGPQGGGLARPRRPDDRQPADRFAHRHREVEGAEPAVDVKGQRPGGALRGRQRPGTSAANGRRATGHFRATSVTPRPTAAAMATARNEGARVSGSPELENWT